MDTIDSEQIDTLERLQQLELEIDRLRRQLEAEPVELHELVATQSFAAAGLEQAKMQLEDMKKTYRDHETDTRITQDHIQKSQAKLRTVKTNKEYQAMLREIDDMKKSISDVETVMLEMLDSIEAAESDVATRQEVHDQTGREIEAMRAELTEARRGDADRLAGLEADAVAVSERISPDLLKLYRQQKRGGIGLVPVANAVCGGCHLNIPPQMYNELQRRDSLKFCPFCERIIYFKQL